MQKRKISSYKAGIREANKNISGFIKEKGRERSRSYSDDLHDSSDRLMYQIKAGKRAGDFNYIRGQAMAYGMFAHTGKKIR